ncbi:MAG: hypothetical protein QM674_11365 [Burkholderiaceae bacterium]
MTRGRLPTRPFPGVRSGDAAAADPGRRRWLRTAAVSPAALMLGACASPAFLPGPATAPPLPVARVGQRWRYQRINRYNDQSLGIRAHTVTQVDGPLVVVTITDGDGATIGQERYEAPWRVIDDLGFDMPQHFARPVPRLPAVLRAGARSTLSTTYRVTGNSSSLAWSQWLTAPGWERITVPAGTYDCLRIERRIQFRHDDLFREWPERSETIWYAPAVERWVLREWTGIYYWPGVPRTRLREDWITSRLIDYTAAPTS